MQVLNAYPTLLGLHVFANTLWIGSIVAVGVIVSARSGSSAVERGRLALLPYRLVAAPAFIASFLLGVVCLVLNPSGNLLRLPSMHAKLTLAVVVIALHHVIGFRARNMALGRSESGPPSFVLPLLIVCAAFAAWLGIVKPF